MEWLHETRIVFPRLDNKIILAEYKKMSNKKLGFVKANFEQISDFNPEALLLGKKIIIKNKRIKPKEFNIYINHELQKIKNPALRKEIIQHILIHELLHIESEDLITLSKQYGRRKRKKVHIKDFHDKIFERYNLLREKKGIIKIGKREHLDIAIQRILESINWFGK